MPNMMIGLISVLLVSLLGSVLSLHNVISGTKTRTVSVGQLLLLGANVCVLSAVFLVAWWIFSLPDDLG